MSGNYSSVDGVKVSKWGPESEPENPLEKFEGEVEEFYFEESRGRLILTVVHPDGETVTNLMIPVTARNSWNSFVDSLPTWDNAD